MAKEQRLIDAMRFVTKLAKKDEFWIIKKVNGLCTVGWKVEFPQMLPKENHINDAAFKDIIFCDALDAHKK
jgi:hypothetical protein